MLCQDAPVFSNMLNLLYIYTEKNVQSKVEKYYSIIFTTSTIIITIITVVVILLNLYFKFFLIHEPQHRVANFFVHIKKHALVGIDMPYEFFLKENQFTFLKD